MTDGVFAFALALRNAMVVRGDYCKEVVVYPADTGRRLLDEIRVSVPVAEEICDLILGPMTEEERQEMLPKSEPD